jgi:hypothetical protein
MSREKMKHHIQNRLLPIGIASILVLSALGLTTTAVPAAFATDNNHDNGDDHNNDHHSKREFLKEVKNCFEEDNNNHDNNNDHHEKFSHDVKDCIKDVIHDFFKNHENHDNHDNGDDNHDN